MFPPVRKKEEEIEEKEEIEEIEEQNKNNRSPKFTRGESTRGVEGICHCLMPDYARRCQTSTLIMVPINF